MPERVQRLRGPEVPAEERALITLVDAHYIDHHALHTEDAQRWSPEQWARAMFEDGRPRLQRTRDLGLLGALLSPPQPQGQVAGWTVTESTAGWIRMESTSQLTSDQIVVHAHAAGASLTTAVRYERRASPIAWRLISTQHRRFAPIVLRRAHRLLASDPVPDPDGSTAASASWLGGESVAGRLARLSGNETPTI